MIREQIQAEGLWKPRSMLAVYLLFGIVSLAVGAGLLTVRHHTLSGIDASRRWAATPCTIEKALFVHDEEGASQLDLQYRYEFQGATYHSDRLDLLPGRIGDDSSWEEELLARMPAGAERTCYVDPDNPKMAVLDREHGQAGAGNLQRLAFPFLIISASFLLAAAKFIFASRRASCAFTGIRSSAFPGELGPPPRPLKPGFVLATFFTTPGQVQLAWAFFLGFAFVFTILEGPSALRDLWPSHQVRVNGEVTRVEGLGQWEMSRQVYEYEFRFTVEDEVRTGKSQTPGQKYQVGDPIEIVFDPQRPGTTKIVGTRHRPAPFWVTVIPLLVLILLGMGIVGSCLAGMLVPAAFLAALAWLWGSPPMSR